MDAIKGHGPYLVYPTVGRNCPKSSVRPDPSAVELPGTTDACCHSHAILAVSQPAEPRPSPPRALVSPRGSPRVASPGPGVAPLSPQADLAGVVEAIGASLASWASPNGMLPWAQIETALEGTPYNDFGAWFTADRLRSLCPGAASRGPAMEVSRGELEVAVSHFLAGQPGFGPKHQAGVSTQQQVLAGLRSPSMERSGRATPAGRRAASPSRSSRGSAMRSRSPGVRSRRNNKKTATLQDAGAIQRAVHNLVHSDGERTEEAPLREVLYRSASRERGRSSAPRAPSEPPPVIQRCLG